MNAALEAHGLKKPPSAAALRMRRMRERNEASQSVTKAPIVRNSNVTKRNEPLNGNAVAYIPIIGGDFGVSKEYLAELETAYPLVDGPATLKQIRAWCLSNPQRQKTARGVTRFINSWFEKDQNHG